MARKEETNQGNDKGHHQNKQQRKTCSKCGKEHLGECLMGTGVCFRCGKPSHFANNCKEKSFSSSNNEQKKTQARVFTMSKKEFEEASTVVIVDGKELLADLIVLDVQDFDIILGMDWLSRYHAMIDYCKKELVFEPPNMPSFCFSGAKAKLSIPIITAMKTRQLLNKGCVAYLASIMEESKMDISIDQVSVVQEYPDVFPDDLTGLPQKREIDFVIDLLPRTTPILKAPYRMALLNSRKSRTNSKIF
ncbi:Uncharacterized protein Adt_35212 [Abeliophyllum distichum]|uniref:CCHC-type domain-containing protein n=1 Tax=Abeliophyllum distichum TaxID=126358 RepID=A0ABD1QI40_9LAMI